MGTLNADARTTKCMFQQYLWNKLPKFRNEGMIKCYVERLSSIFFFFFLIGIHSMQG